MHSMVSKLKMMKYGISDEVVKWVKKIVTLG